MIKATNHLKSVTILLNGLVYWAKLILFGWNKFHITLKHCIVNNKKKKRKEIKQYIIFIPIISKIKKNMHYLIQMRQSILQF